MKSFLFFAILSITTSSVCADSPQENNQELLALYNADQSARKKESIDWKNLATQDEDRRRAVMEMVRAGALKTSEDYRHAAMIFQHGTTADEIRMAFSLAWMAQTLDPANKRAKWLSAAAWDRIMMHEDMPQWYGTQFYRPTLDSPWELYKVDESAVTDDDRARMTVRPLAESKAKVNELNAEK